MDTVPIVNDYFISYYHHIYELSLKSELVDLCQYRAREAVEHLISQKTTKNKGAESPAFQK